MKRGLRRSSVVIFGLLVLANFNNCGVYEAGSEDANGFLRASLDCESEVDCVAKDNVNLKVTPLPNSNFPVIPSLKDFNVGGDCNEAGYSNHQIVWTLKLNNIVVRHSGMIIEGKSRHSSCVNGKFRAYVNLGWLNEDPVARDGLLVGSGATRASYDLQFEIMALDNSGNWIRNLNQGGIKSITLIPVE